MGAESPRHYSETLRTSDGLVVTAAGLTDIGCKRTINQDTLGDRVGQFADRLEQHGLLYAVADGMGGHAHGEVASALAIETLFARYYAVDPAQAPQQTLDRVLRATNTTVHDASRAAGGEPMGTTLTTALLRGNALYVGNIGDSRTYLIRDGRIKQLSHDHSLIGEQIRRGLLTEQQARASAIRNVITRAVGYSAEVEPDVFAFTIEADDRLLLCSDGLHGLIENEELAHILGTGPLDEAVRAAIALARERGGPDNITALALKIDRLGAAVAAASDQPEAARAAAATDRLETTSAAVADAETSPFALIQGDDTPRTLPPRAASQGGAGRRAQPGVPPARTAPSPPPAPVTVLPAPAGPPPRRATRAPLWLFVLLPLLIIALLVGGSFIFIKGRGERQETTPPGATVPAIVPATAVPATATSPGGLAPATPQQAASTAAPASGGAQLPAPSRTTAPTKGRSLVDDLPTPTVAPTVGGQTTVSGTVTVGRELAIPADFPDRWHVVIFDQAEWEREPRSATVRGTAGLDRPFGQNIASGLYTFHLALPTPPAGGAYILQLRRDDGSRVATTEGGTITLASGTGGRIQDVSVRVTGFGAEAEIGR